MKFLMTTLIVLMLLYVGSYVALRFTIMSFAVHRSGGRITPWVYFGVGGDLVSHAASKFSSPLVWIEEECCPPDVVG